MSEGHVLEVCMDLSTTSEGRHIVSSDLSSDGTYICTSFTTKVTLYMLRSVHEGSEAEIMGSTATISLPETQKRKRRQRVTLEVVPLRSTTTAQSTLEEQEANKVLSRGAHFVRFFPSRNTIAVASNAEEVSFYS
jgi:hypothetical protein